MSNLDIFKETKAMVDSMKDTNKTKPAITRYWWNDDTVLFPKEDGELVKYADHKATVEAQALEIERLKGLLNRSGIEQNSMLCNQTEDFHSKILNEIDPLGQELA
jgi:hypothetical protein